MAMEKQNCGACNGSGQVMNGADEYGMPRWSTCLACGGQGGRMVYRPDEYSGRGSSGRQQARDPLQSFAELLTLVVWAAIAYVGITRVDVEWYWPTGIGLVVALALQKPLLGPLRPFTAFLQRVVSWVLTLIILGFLAMFAYSIWDGSAALK